MTSRDEFSSTVKRELEYRVASKCSKPGCGNVTRGPKSGQSDKSISLGEAGHITAAAEGGPRFDQSLTNEQRASISNGIWLCLRCHKLVDRDDSQFDAITLRSWKKDAERHARMAMEFSELTNVQPPILTSEQEELCVRLDELHINNGLGSKPSEMFRGALVAAQPPMRNLNPDWLAQAAHSLRDILHPIYSPKAKNGLKVKKGEAFVRAGGVRGEEGLRRLNAVYGTLTDLAHHAHPGNDGSGREKFGDAEFRVLLEEFVAGARHALSGQIELHADVDSFMEQW